VGAAVGFITLRLLSMFNHLGKAPTVPPNLADYYQDAYRVVWR
jgi:hypothetical protein